ncbi:electron transport complex protein RnfE [Natronincola peptidivorans]|uniref:Ion-translocating oxidoreductase complex subunit E n=2 Tax=Natronincola peptidivorans TaxID=426128 RepID=A0A1H9Z0Z6_9FIRM|nr:electron transport complex subunit E [Natronincola peptidivorans]SES75169.1 electron transport complex protein RnfE [Natronincola peptidivorans]
MKPNRIFMKGILYDNPVFIQMLGMCPVLAVTNTAFNGFGMGMATTAVLVGSNTVISLIKQFIPSKIRIPSFIVVIATFVTIVGMLLRAYLPALNEALGIFIPLIVVNCLILARAESFASKNSTPGSIIDGLGMGLGFTAALVVLGIVREWLGVGTIFGQAVMWSTFEPARFMSMPPGAFLALGLLLAGFNKIMSKDLNEL